MERTIAKYVAPLLLGGTLAATLCCGLGDTIVTGIGNGGNRFYRSSVVDELAEQLASNEVVEPVTDEMLRQAFGAISGRAEEGDPEAALILFRVAAEQRKTASE